MCKEADIYIRFPQCAKHGLLATGASLQIFIALVGGRPEHCSMKDSQHWCHLLGDGCIVYGEGRKSSVL